MMVFVVKPQEGRKRRGRLQPPAMCVRRAVSPSDSDVMAVHGPGVKRHVTCPARGGGGQSAILGDVTASAAAGPNSCDIVTV